MPASRAGIEGMRRLKEAIEQADVISVPLVNPGDTVIIDNWRMLHGRSNVPISCVHRIIDRTYLGRLH